MHLHAQWPASEAKLRDTAAVTSHRTPRREVSATMAAATRDEYRVRPSANALCPYGADRRWEIPVAAAAVQCEGDARQIVALREELAMVRATLAANEVREVRLVLENEQLAAKIYEKRRTLASAADPAQDRCVTPLHPATTAHSTPIQPI